LKNILFLPFQPREKFCEVLSSADLSLVTINPESAQSSLPSKVFNCMASGRAILSVAPAESDLAMVIQESACGVNVPPGSPEAIASEILSLKDQSDLLEKMGLNARSELETKYARERCVEQHEEMLAKLQGKQRASAEKNKQPVNPAFERKRI
jgi:colanic acid biosynthesis glycosyl transferase WcaI